MPRTLTEGVGKQTEPRPVRKTNADPATVVSRDGPKLAPEFTCPVCLRILRKTEIVVECLHRFCGDCIQKCLRVAKHECPSCRVRVPSRRSLKRDAAFDALIATVYPDLDAFERGEEAETRAFNDKRRRQTGDRRAQAYAQHAEVQRRKPPPVPRPAPRPRAAPRAPARVLAHPAAARRAPAQPRGAPAVVNFVLRQHPHETGVGRLAREYLSTSDQLKVTHLKKFLGLKLSYAPVEDFEVLVALENQCVVLNDQLSLGQIVAHFATDADVEVVLHYRLQRPMGT